MAANGGHIGTVPGGVAVQACPVEEQSVIQHHRSVQHQLGSHHALPVGIAVDGAAGGRAKLILLENHALHRVGELVAGHSVHHHVAHCDLPRHRLIAALRIDDVGEPIEIIAVVIGTVGVSYTTVTGYVMVSIVTTGQPSK